MKWLLITLMFISFSCDANIKLNDKGLDCLIKNAYYEANTEGDIGMLLVTNVVFNRTSGRDFCKTIYKPFQFSWTLGKHKKIPNDIYYDIKSNIGVFMRHRQMIPHRFAEATFYHKRGEHPKWAPKLKYLGAYKQHLFYRS